MGDNRSEQIACRAIERAQGKSNNHCESRPRQEFSPRNEVDDAKQQTRHDKPHPGLERTAKEHLFRESARKRQQQAIGGRDRPQRPGHGAREIFAPHSEASQQTRQQNNAESQRDPNAQIPDPVHPAGPCGGRSEEDRLPVQANSPEHGDDSHDAVEQQSGANEVWAGGTRQGVLRFLLRLHENVLVAQFPPGS